METKKELNAEQILIYTVCPVCQEGCSTLEEVLEHDSAPLFATGFRDQDKVLRYVREKKINGKGFEERVIPCSVVKIVGYILEDGMHIPKYSVRLHPNPGVESIIQVLGTSLMRLM